jgi:hypothetical protein
VPSLEDTNPLDEAKLSVKVRPSSIGRADVEVGDCCAVGMGVVAGIDVREGSVVGKSVEAEPVEVCTSVV